MSGVREKKKRQTEEAILRCAEELFSRQGFPATTMEEIAESAVVGVGTLYNYFGGKGDLLIAIMAAKTEGILSEGLPTLSKRHDDAVGAVSSLLGNYVCGLLRIDHGLIREMFSLAIGHPDSFGHAMLDLDQQLIRQLAVLLSHLQEKGLMSSEIDPEHASLVLYSQACTLMMLWIMTKPPDEEEVRQRIRETVKLVFCDWIGKR